MSVSSLIRSACPSRYPVSPSFLLLIPSYHREGIQSIPCPRDPLTKHSKRSAKTEYSYTRGSFCAVCTIWGGSKHTVPFCFSRSDSCPFALFVMFATKSRAGLRGRQGPVGCRQTALILPTVQHTFCPGQNKILRQRTAGEISGMGKLWAALNPYNRGTHPSWGWRPAR